MKRLLEQTCKLIAERPSKQLDESEYKNLRPPDPTDFDMSPVSGDWSPRGLRRS